MGLVYCAYRCGREASINAMIEEACARTGRTSRPVSTDEATTDSPMPIATEDDDDFADLPIHMSHAISQKTPVVSAPPVATTAVPELTHPGESQSNGLAERSVRAIEEHTRTVYCSIRIAHQHNDSI